MWVPRTCARFFGLRVRVLSQIEYTPLDWAKSLGQTEVARLLEAAGGRGKR